MATPVLVLPGFGNSGPDHWQTRWEQRHPDWRRVDLGQWEAPICTDWVARLNEAVRRCAAPPVFIAHSLGCLLVSHWVQQSAATIHGALLVAIPEPGTTGFPPTAHGFTPVPMQPFQFPSIVVASANDPFGSSAFARRCAMAWGSRFVDVGAAGHINADSRLGDWSEGYALVESLTK